MKRIEAQARWKNNPVTLSSWSDMRPTFHLDSPRTESETEGDKERKGRRGGGESVPLPRSLFLFPLFVHAQRTHTHSAIDFKLGPHQLCAWWNKHWQPLYICKGPCSSCARPPHTQPLNRRPSPSWGLQDEPTLHKMALAAFCCAFLLFSLTCIYRHTHTHTSVSCSVRQNTAVH